MFTLSKSLIWLRWCMLLSLYLISFTCKHNLFPNTAMRSLELWFPVCHPTWSFDRFDTTTEYIPETPIFFWKIGVSGLFSGHFSGNLNCSKKELDSCCNPDKNTSENKIYISKSWSWHSEEFSIGRIFAEMFFAFACPIWGTNKMEMWLDFRGLDGFWPSLTIQDNASKTYIEPRIQGGMTSVWCVSPPCFWQLEQIFCDFLVKHTQS